MGRKKLVAGNEVRAYSGCFLWLLAQRSPVRLLQMWCRRPRSRSARTIDAPVTSARRQPLFLAPRNVTPVLLQHQPRQPDQLDVHGNTRSRDDDTSSPHPSSLLLLNSVRSTTQYSLFHSARRSRGQDTSSIDVVRPSKINCNARDAAYCNSTPASVRCRRSVCRGIKFERLAMPFIKLSLSLRSHPQHSVYASNWIHTRNTTSEGL